VREKIGENVGERDWGKRTKGKMERDRVHYVRECGFIELFGLAKDLWPSSVASSDTLS